MDGVQAFPTCLSFMIHRYLHEECIRFLRWFSELGYIHKGIYDRHGIRVFTKMELSAFVAGWSSFFCMYVRLGMQSHIR